MAGVMVQELHTLAGCHTVYNVQTNHDNKLARNDSP